LTIKDENELARYMGAALKSYANQVLNGRTKPYRKFLEGAETVTITIHLAEPGGIIVEDPKEEVIQEVVAEPAQEEAQIESVAPLFTPEPEEKKVKPRRVKRSTT